VKSVASPAKQRDSEQLPARSRRGPMWLKIAVFVVSMLSAAVLCEGVLRLLGYSPPGEEVGDPVLGFTTGRNRTEIFEFPEYGGLLRVHVNNLGFFEEADTEVVKAPGSYRIVAVGDSQTAGECADNESFPNALEELLNHGLPGGNVEVINAGAGRYSPYQYYVKAKTQLVQLHPDQLIVGIYMGNDLMDLIRHDDRPYLTVGPGGTVVHHNPEFVMLKDPATARSTLESLRLVALGEHVLGPSLLYQVRRAHLLAHDVEGHANSPLDVASYMIEVKRLTDISLGFMTQALLQHVWFEHFPSTLPTALFLNGEVMKLFRELCSANHIRLTYVLIPTKLMIEPDDFRPVLEKVARVDNRLTLGRLQRTEEQLTEATIKQCQALGIEVINLLPELRERRAGRRLYNPEEMHLRPVGNRAIALILYEALSNSIVADMRQSAAKPLGTPPGGPR